MVSFSVSCFNCGKTIFRSNGRINEAKKFGWKAYCSLDCQKKVKYQRTTFICSRPGCNRKFNRQPNEIKKSKKLYCSRSCAVTVNNRKFPKRKALIKKCKYCWKKFTGDAIKYCSVECQYKGATVSKKEILKLIVDFYKKKRRIPLKREFSHYHAASGRYGTWNNAIKAAGFEPNPVMFAKKYIANDGHKCDSLAEKIIDDWLYARKIPHDINVSYPGSGGLTADFKVADYWIEFFGLSGEHKRYDELKEEKMKIAEKRKLKLIEIYPNHLFPKNKLSQTLSEITG